MQALHAALKNPDAFANIVKRRTPRQLKHFSMPTRTQMSIDTLRNCNVLEVNSPDRPGLLARIARVFVDYDINVLNAKIITLGETVEDIFFISNKHGQAFMDEALCSDIQKTICSTVDSQNETPDQLNKVSI